MVLLKAAHNAPRRLEYPSLIISMYRLGSREGVFADEPHHGLVSEDLVLKGPNPRVVEIINQLELVAFTKAILALSGQNLA